MVPSFYPARAYGGPCVTVYAIAKMLSEMDNDVRVLTTDADGRRRLTVPVNVPVQIDRHLSVTYCSRSWGETVSLGLMKQLRQNIRWTDTVILSGIFSSTTIPTLILCRRLRKSLLWLPHGALMKTCLSQKPRRKAVWNKACRLVCRGVTGFRFVTNSAIEARDCAEAFPELKVTVVPHTVEVPECIYPMELGGRLRLLYVGRLHPIKGIENLIRAVSLVQRSKTTLRWELKIAGSGETSYDRSLKELAASLGLSRNVMFTGPVFGDVKEMLFRESHVVVVPSYSENFCAVVGEGLARARPVITTIGVPWDGIWAHNCGLRVAGTPEALSEAIIQISGMDLHSMGLAGRKWIAEEFSEGRISRLWCDVLDTCVAATVGKG